MELDRLGKLVSNVTESSVGQGVLRTKDLKSLTKKGREVRILTTVSGDTHEVVRNTKKMCGEC